MFNALFDFEMVMKNSNAFFTTKTYSKIRYKKEWARICTQKHTLNDTRIVESMHEKR